MQLVGRMSVYLSEVEIVKLYSSSLIAGHIKFKTWQQFVIKFHVIKFYLTYLF